MKRKLLIKIIAVFFLFITALYLYFQFGWSKYEDQTYDFTIEHPISWKYSPNENKNADELARIGWYYDTGTINEHSGKTNKIGMTVFIYEPSNIGWGKWLDQLEKSMRYMKAEKSNIIISGMKTEEYELPAILYVGPIEHNGKSYYFIGENNQDVKRMLSTFKFTN